MGDCNTVPKGTQIREVDFFLGFSDGLNFKLGNHSTSYQMLQFNDYWYYVFYHVLLYDLLKEIHSLSKPVLHFSEMPTCLNLEVSLFSSP